MPADRDMGVWRGAWITSSGAVNVRFPQVQTSLNSNLTSAALTVTAELNNPTSSSVTGTLSGTITPGNLTFSQTVTVPAGATKQLVTFSPSSFSQLNISNPALWWPANVGPQNLYRCDLKFTAGSTVSDTESFNFGIRKIESGLGATAPDGNQYRWFKINNQSIMIKGGGWSYDMLMKHSTARLEQELLYVKDLNLNSIRLEGMLEDQTFYDLADQNGIMIMAGWVCCTQWENWSNWSTENNNVAMASLDSQMRATRNHPSFFAWLNGSDNLPPSNIETQEHNIEVADHWPNAIVGNASYDTSSVTGNTGVKMNGPYEWEPPVYWYSDTGNGGAFGFSTEISVGPEVPPMESMETMLNTNPIPWPIDSTWNYHRGGSPFNNLNTVTSALDARYGTATDAADYIRKSQAQNYESTRAMFEGYEAYKSKTDGSASTGVIQWMLNKSWPSVHWQLYDWYLRQGSGYFGAKKGSESLHIQWDSAFHNDVYVINDYYQTYSNLVATADVYNFDLTSKYHNSVTLTAGPDSSNVAFTIPTISGLSTTYFVRLQLKDSAGNVVSNNFYWYSTTPDKPSTSCSWYLCADNQYANMSSLSTLPTVTVNHADSFGTDAATVTLTNAGSSLAFLVRVRVMNGSEEVLPAFWNDNDVFLLPGESRTLTATFQPGSLPAGATVLVDGFNVVGGAATADFSVSASPSSQTVIQGSGTSYTTTVAPLNGFTGSVALSVSGLPTGATASFSPTSVSGSGSSTLTVSTSSSTPTGASTLTITGKSGSLTHTTAITLNVNAVAQKDFTISATPASQTITQGSNTSYTTTITAVNGFSGAVSLSVTGVPTGATASFSPASVSGAGTSTFGLSTSSTTPAGSYTLTIAGVSGNLTHSATVTLVVNSTTSKAIYQVNSGGSAASPFIADKYFSGGQTSSVSTTVSTSGVSNPAPAAVYKSERWGGDSNSNPAPFSYTFSSLTAGATYKVRLHFAEIYWTATGQRKFNVAINSTTVLSNFDIVAAAGGANKAIVKEFTATANSSGKIVISFAVGSADAPKISGIEILQ